MNKIPASLKSIDVKAILRKRGIYLEQKVNREMKEAALPIARQIIQSRKKVEPPRHHQFTNDQVQEYWEKQIHIVDVLEKKLDHKLQQFIVKIVEGFLKTLDSEVNKDFFDDNEESLLIQAQLDFTPLLIDQAVLAGQEAYKLIGSKDIYTPFKLRETIAANVAKFTQSMLDTDRQKLVDIVADGIKNGESIPQIRNAIQLDFERISKTQAQLVTRTEVLRASNQAALDAYEQSGVVEGKQWITFGAVDECATYEGKVESLGGSFYERENEFTDGDPPLHPNCRCILLPVLIGEKALMPRHNIQMQQRIKELEDQIDKRTKQYREIKEAKIDDEIKIRRLEKLLTDTP